MDLTQANTAIRTAWKASLVSIAATILLTLVYATGGSLANVDWWNWLDIVMMLALTYGVYKKSRASAVTLFVYYLLGKIYIWIISGAIIGLPIAFIFAYFFFRGIQGVFTYHRLMDDEETAVTYSH